MITSEARLGYLLKSQGWENSIGIILKAQLPTDSPRIAKLVVMMDYADFERRPTRGRGEPHSLRARLR